MYVWWSKCIIRELVLCVFLLHLPLLHSVHIFYLDNYQLLVQHQPILYMWHAIQTESIGAANATPAKPVSRPMYNTVTFESLNL